MQIPKIDTIASLHSIKPTETKASVAKIQLNDSVSLSSEAQKMQEWVRLLKEEIPDVSGARIKSAEQALRLDPQALAKDMLETVAKKMLESD